MASLYRIKNWARHYEKAQTRKVGNAQWVPLPVKHDGKGFRRLMAMENGPAIYGAWVLIVQVAAKCVERGTLADEDGPLTSEDLTLKTGCDKGLFDEALQVLCSEKIGWMLVSEWAPDTTAIDELGKPLQLQDSTRQDSTEQDNTADRQVDGIGPTTHASMIPIPPSLNFPPFRAAWERWIEHLRQKGNRPSQLTLTDQLVELERAGPEAAIGKINYSIRQGYVGLHEAGGNYGKPKIDRERHRI